ncbi:MAG: hypothetical protein NTW38_03035 [Candidatus Aminicenantes bacterium]|nr:hypothetical protein [Candidatus Aminicenantes bacterium]
MACLSCNVPNYKDGGYYRAATKDEEAAWYAREEAKLAQFLADAPKRAKETAEFNRRNFKDGKF